MLHIIIHRVLNNLQLFLRLSVLIFIVEEGGMFCGLRLLRKLFYIEACVYSIMYTYNISVVCSEVIDRIFIKWNVSYYMDVVDDLMTYFRTFFYCCIGIRFNDSEFRVLLVLDGEKKKTILDFSFPFFYFDKCQHINL